MNDQIAIEKLHRRIPEAAYPIVARKSWGCVIETAGGQVSLPRRRASWLRSSKTAEEALKELRAAAKKSKVADVVVLCTRAGSGPTEKSCKIKLEILEPADYEEMEKRPRTMTVPVSQLITAATGERYIPAWVVRKKLRQGEQLSLDQLRWRGEDAAREQLESWFAEYDRRYGQSTGKRTANRSLHP